MLEVELVTAHELSRRGGRRHRREDRAGVGPEDRGDALGRSLPHRRHGAPGRLVPGRRERARPPQLSQTRARRPRLKRKGPHRETPPGRDHLDPEAANRGLRRRDEPERGRHRAADRRRHRPRLRPRERVRHGDARVRARRHRSDAQPRGGQRRRRAVRRLGEDRGGSAGPALRPARERSGRRRARREDRRPPRQPARRAGPDRVRGTPADRVQGSGRRRAAAGQGAAPDRAEGDRLDDPDRARPARADHRRPLDRQDGDPDRHDPQPAWLGRDLRLRRNRPEGVERRAGPPAPQGRRRDGLHDHRQRSRLRGRADQVDGSLRRLRHGRALPLLGTPRALHVRRPLEARRRVPADVAAAPPPAGPRGLPRRRLLPPLPSPRAGLQAERRARRRLAHRAAGDRDPGGRRVRVHPDERHLDHRRADLPRVRSLLLGRAAGDQRRHLRLAGRRECADEGDEEGRRPSPARPGSVPEPRGVRAVRLGARRGDPPDARARRENGGLAQPAAVHAVAVRGAGRSDLRGHPRLPLRGADCAGAALPGRAARVPAHRGNRVRRDP